MCGGGIDYRLSITSRLRLHFESTMTKQQRPNHANKTFTRLLSLLVGSDNKTCPYYSTAATLPPVCVQNVSLLDPFRGDPSPTNDYLLFTVEVENLRTGAVETTYLFYHRTHTL